REARGRGVRPVPAALRARQGRVESDVQPYRRDARGRLLLGHGGHPARDPGCPRDARRLHRWQDEECHLSRREPRRHRSRRGRRGGLRSGEAQLRGAARLLLPHARPHDGEPPAQRRRHAVPLGDLLSRRRAAADRRAREGARRALGEVGRPDRDGDRPRRRVLDRRGLSSEVSREAPRRVQLPLSARLTVASLYEGTRFWNLRRAHMRFVAALALALGLGCRLLARLPVHDACALGETVVGGMVEPGARDVVVPVRKKAWEAAFGGEEAARPHVRARLTGWPSRALVDRATLPSTDREFVARLARDTWRGLEAFTDREDHLPVDNVRFAETSVDGAGARVGDYTNVTSVGLRLIALVAAADLDLVPRTEAIRRVRRLLATLEGLETYRGFFYNYYDTTSRERTSNFLSFVDSSWLTAGLMVVRTAFPELGEPCSRIIAAQDYRFFYDAARRRMSHGYYVHLASHSRYHYGTLYA